MGAGKRENSNNSRSLISIRRVHAFRDQQKQGARKKNATLCAQTHHTLCVFDTSLVLVVLRQTWEICFIFSDSAQKNNVSKWKISDCIFAAWHTRTLLQLCLYRQCVCARGAWSKISKIDHCIASGGVIRKVKSNWKIWPAQRCGRRSCHWLHTAHLKKCAWALHAWAWKQGEELIDRGMHRGFCVLIFQIIPPSDMKYFSQLLKHKMLLKIDPGRGLSHGWERPGRGLPSKQTRYRLWTSPKKK